ncbi:hypothetical protein SCALM49S_04119 [Streptomyces californicus]
MGHPFPPSESHPQAFLRVAATWESRIAQGCVSAPRPAKYRTLVEKAGPRYAMALRFPGRSAS